MGRPSRTRDRLTALLRRSYHAQNRRLASQRNRSLRRLEGAYSRFLDMVSDDLRALMDQAITPGMTTRQLRTVSTMTRLQDALRTELAKVAGVLGDEAAAMQTSGIEAGRASGIATLERLGQATISRPGLDAVTQVINYVDKPAFRENLASYGAYHADHVADILIADEMRGIGPIAAARHVAQYTKVMPLADAVRTARTVQLWSARAANRETFRANRDIVSGWWWSSARDATTCESCWAMEGTVHDVDEILDDHHMGRCAPVPITSAIPGFDLQSAPQPDDGETLFKALPESEQRAIMGPAKFAAWQDGIFEFGDLSRTYEDNVYGTMRRAATLAELIGDDASKAYRRPAA